MKVEKELIVKCLKTIGIFLKHSTPIEREVFQTYGKEFQTYVEGFETHYNRL